jgi:hypothetical protein
MTSSATFEVRLFDGVMMRRHALLACLTIALAVPAFPAVARADDAATVEAQARFQEGLDLADAGKHEPARLKFQQAWSVFKSPAVLYNLARAEQLTGHELEALEHFRLFIRVGATDVKITDAMREKAKQNAADLARKVGQIEIEVPASARVTVDGRPLEETPKDPVPVQPGRHTIEATFDGKVRNVTVECLAGNVVKARIDFDTPGGATEPPGEERHGRGWSSARIVTVSALTAGAIAGGVLFFVFHGKAQSNVDDSKALLNGGSCVGVTNDVCTKAASLKSDRDSNVTLSTVSLVAGGVLAAGAITAAVLWPKRSSESARITPIVAPGYGGASFVGSF